MSTLSGRQQRRIKRSIVKELVETEIKCLKKNVPTDENDNDSDATLDCDFSSPCSRMTDGYDTNSTSDSSEISYSITEGNESNTANNEGCGYGDYDHYRNVGDVNVSAGLHVPDNIEIDRNFIIANIAIENKIYESENDTESIDSAESSSTDITSEDVDSEGVYPDSSVQYSDSDNESDGNVSTDSNCNNTVGVVCSYNLEERNSTSKLYAGANISQDKFFIAFLSMFYQHGLTYSCGTDFLSFVKRVLPSPNLVIQSPHSLIEQLIKYNDATTTHRCCGYCAQPLVDVSTCIKTECVSASLPDSSFIEVHLDKQLPLILQKLTRPPTFHFKFRVSTLAVHDFFA